jgi:hypothetical protein
MHCYNTFSPLKTTLFLPFNGKNILDISEN